MNFHASKFCFSAKQLMGWMMKVDPARRCSAKEVLHDPWILVSRLTSAPQTMQYSH